MPFSFLRVKYYGVSIEDNKAREKKFKQVVENAEGYQLLLANAYMKLAEKNQDEDFKKHTRFLKIFPILCDESNFYGP